MGWLKRPVVLFAGASALLIGTVVLLSSCWMPGSFCGCGKAPNAVRMKLQAVSHAVRQFSVQHGRYPSEAEGLAVLAEPHDGVRPYLRRAPHDPWGRAVQYFSPPRKGEAPFEVFSVGADGEIGTADDIHLTRR